MIIDTYADFPPFRSDLKKEYGYLSFQCALVNVDVVGIRSKRHFDIVIITFRGQHKTGFIYEGNRMTQEQVLEAFNDVPNDRNNLEEYIKNFGDRVDVLIPIKNNFVFVDDETVQPINKKEYDRICKEKAKKDFQHRKRSPPTE